MARVFTYVIIATTMIILLEMAGFPTGLTNVINYLGINPNAPDVSNSAFFGDIAAIFGGAILAAIIIGTFTRTPPESYIISGVVLTILTTFASTFMAVINYSANFDIWVRYLVFIIFLPFSVGFVLSTIEFWRGTA